MKANNLREVIEAMLTELSGVSRASENTVDAYKRDLKQFMDFCEEKSIYSINSISEKQIRWYLMTLSEAGIDKSSVSRKLSSLRRLFNFALKNDIIEFNPINKIPNPKVKRKLPETINLDSFEEIYRLLDKENDTYVISRNKAIFELLYGCALRVSELCALNINDLDLKRMNVRVLGKGSKVRIAPIGSKSLDILNDYLEKRSQKNFVEPLFFGSDERRISRQFVYKLVKKYISQVSDIKKKSPHILRHSAATHMMDRDADIMAVKEILGHENLSTTQIYTHVSVERLKKSYKKAHPKS